jgi:hypothetical protein
LSENAKLAYLQEKINEAKKKSRDAGFIVITGSAIITLGVIIGGSLIILIGTETQGYVFLTICLITGALFAVYGFYAANKYNNEYKNLMKEFGEMTIQKPKCPNCGKELPEGNFEFCPFCGKSLKQSTQ